MVRPTGHAVGAVAWVLALTAIASANADTDDLGLDGQDWSTIGSDAQRTSWLQEDYAISAQTLQQSGLAFLWKLELGERTARDSLGQAVMGTRVIGYRGFKSLTFLGGPEGTVYAVDFDLGESHWSKHLNEAVDAGACSQSRTSVSVPLRLAGYHRRFFAETTSHGVEFKSAVGEPGKGPPDLFHGGGEPPTQPAVVQSEPAGSLPPAPDQRFDKRVVYAVTHDGLLHALDMPSGQEVAKPVPFVPPGSLIFGLIIADSVAYAATAPGCGNPANAVWALNIRASAPAVSWKSSGGPVAGAAGFAVGTDRTLYVALGNLQASQARDSNAVLALEGTTLREKSWFSRRNAHFSSTPVVFNYQGKQLVAAAAQDGRVFLLDGTALGGSDHKTPLSVSAALPGKPPSFAAGMLATWQDTSGSRWILESFVGPGPAKVRRSNGAGSNGGILALRIAGDASRPTLEPIWVSRDMVSPLAPIVVNGVVFAVSSGDLTADAAQTGTQQATLYALDGTTGKELWNSGTTVTSSVRPGALSASSGQVYLTARDNTLYAFGTRVQRDED
jgi:outer membrane protein assembly factor BamB